MSDMFFDTSDFDFTTLKDIVGFDNEPQKPTRTTPDKMNELGGVVDDISDIIGDVDLDFNDTDEDSEPDFNADARDLEPVEKRNGVDLTSYFRDTDDEAYIDFDGRTMTKKEIKELAKTQDKLKEDSEFLRSQAERFDADNRWINERSIMQQNVIENNISKIKGRLSRIDPINNATAYGEESYQLQMAEQALFMIQKETGDILRHREQQQQQINGYRIRVADQALSSESQDWMKYKGEILNYAVNDMGIPASVLEKNYDVGLMKMAMKAFMFDKNKKAYNERLKAQQTAKNVRSTQGAKSSTRTAQEDAATSQRKAKAIKAMGTGRQGNIDAFNFLRD